MRIYRHQRLLGALMLAAIGTACASIMGVDEEPKLNTARDTAVGASDGGGADGPLGPNGQGTATCLGRDCACVADKDCVDPTLPKCAKGFCRACAIGFADSSDPVDTCSDGNYCSVAEFVCTPGCKSDAECAKLTILPFCVPSRHQCVACRDGHPEDCTGVSQVCSASGVCVDRCNDGGVCPNGKKCCSNLCVDVATDIYNCSDCNIGCPSTVANAVTVCTAGACDYTACNAGFADCDTNRKNGCECVPCGVVNGACCPTNPKCSGNARCGNNNTCRSCKPAGAGCGNDFECCSDSCNSSGGSSRKCQ